MKLCNIKCNIKALPHKPWQARRLYDSIMLVNSGKKHDSGYAIMLIVGVNKLIPQEIAGECDDINRIIPDDEMRQYSAPLRTERGYRGHIMFWSPYCRFEVGHSLSSTDIKLIKKYY